jgi:hypothetical protein
VVRVILRVWVADKRGITRDVCARHHFPPIEPVTLSLRAGWRYGAHKRNQCVGMQTIPKWG